MTLLRTARLPVLEGVRPEVVMLFVGDVQDGFVQRAAVFGALFGVVRSVKRLWQADPAELLEVERYTGHLPGDAYSDLGFRPPADGVARLKALSS